MARAGRALLIIFMALVLLLTWLRTAFSHASFSSPEPPPQTVPLAAGSSALMEGGSPGVRVWMPDRREIMALLDEEERRRTAPVRGIFVPGPILEDGRWFSGTMNLIETTELNALVLDIKDESGLVTHPSHLEAVQAIGAIKPRVEDLAGLVEGLRAKGLYPIARVVAFKDSRLAAARPDLAITLPGGGLWRDRSGAAWLDPNSREAQDYIIDVALEAVQAGFPEVQFDYVRFPTDGPVSLAVFPHDRGDRPRDVIAAFLEEARLRLAAEGAVVSADVFGLVPSAEDDMGIGQHWESVARSCDFLSPMAYPSHYGPNVYGLPDPDAAPYATVRRTMQDGLARLGDEKVRIRPWLQSFSWRHTYGPTQIRAQMQAVYDSGLNSWLLWNAGGTYIPASLLPAASEGRRAD